MQGVDTSARMRTGNVDHKDVALMPDNYRAGRADQPDNDKEAAEKRADAEEVIPSGGFRPTASNQSRPASHAQLPATPVVRKFSLRNAIDVVIIESNGVTTTHIEVPFPLYNWPDTADPAKQKNSPVRPSALSVDEGGDL